MKILWVATKPPSPQIDGGRVLMWHTMKALAQRGADLTLVAPADDGDDTDAVAHLRSFCRPILVKPHRRHRLSSFSRALREGAPFTIVHHRSDGVRDQIAMLLSSEIFDLVHAEQAHAIANCESARNAKVPIVFRAQNVESDLWEGLATRSAILALILRREARRLRAWEAEAVRRSDATIALTNRDADRLRVLTNGSLKIHQVAAPFPSSLAPAKEQCPLSGDPAVVLFGSSGWAPNSDGARWFIGKVWPAISNLVPNAVLHAFGGAAIGGNPRNLVQHAAPLESSEAFSPGSILVVPLRIASGVRIKILEAWARGIPVIATSEAAEGLDAADGAELLIARDPREFANAIGRIHQPGMREAIVARAREKLRAEHDPGAIAEKLLAIYRSVVTTRIES